MIKFYRAVDRFRYKLAWKVALKLGTTQCRDFEEFYECKGTR